jgi:hypothetical protein
MWKSHADPNCDSYGNSYGNAFWVAAHSDS